MKDICRVLIQVVSRFALTERCEPGVPAVGRGGRYFFASRNTVTVVLPPSEKVRAPRIYEGTSEIQRLIIARQLLREADGAG